MAHFKMDTPDYWGKVPTDLVGLRETAEMEGIKFAMFVIGEELDDDAPVAIVVQIPPDTPLPRHAHVGYRRQWKSFPSGGEHTKSSTTTVLATYSM
jgi:hypothetical protein